MDSNTPVWPNGLLTPLMGRKHTKVPRATSSQMETGRMRNRPQFTEVIELIDVQWNFPEDQYEAFKEFFETTLQNGSLSFVLTTYDASPIPLTLYEVTREVAFMENMYSFVRGDNVFTVSATLEIVVEEIAEVPDEFAIEEEEMEPPLLEYISPTCRYEFSLTMKHLKVGHLYGYQVAGDRDIHIDPIFFPSSHVIPDPNQWDTHVFFALLTPQEIAQGQSTVVFNNDYGGKWKFRAVEFLNGGGVKVISGPIRPARAAVDPPTIYIPGLTLIDDSMRWAGEVDTVNRRAYRISNVNYIDPNGLWLRLSKLEDPLNFKTGVYTAFQNRFAGRWFTQNKFGNLEGVEPSPRFYFPIQLFGVTGEGRYTLDGSDPTLDSPRITHEGYLDNVAPHWDESIQLVKARCFYGDCKSPVAVVGIDKVMRSEMLHTRCYCLTSDISYYCDLPGVYQKYGYFTIEGETNPTWGPLEGEFGLAWSGQSCGLTAEGVAKLNSANSPAEGAASLGANDVSDAGAHPGPGYTTVQNPNPDDTLLLGQGPNFVRSITYGHTFPLYHKIGFNEQFASLYWSVGIQVRRLSHLRDWVIYNFPTLWANPSAAIWEEKERGFWSSIMLTGATAVLDNIDLQGQPETYMDSFTGVINNIFNTSFRPPSMWGLDVVHSPFYPLGLYPVYPLLFANPRAIAWGYIDYVISQFPEPVEDDPVEPVSLDSRLNLDDFQGYALTDTEGEQTLDFGNGFSGAWVLVEYVDLSGEDDFSNAATGWEDADYTETGYEGFLEDWESFGAGDGIMQLKDYTFSLRFREDFFDDMESYSLGGPEEEDSNNVLPFIGDSFTINHYSCVDYGWVDDMESYVSVAGMTSYTFAAYSFSQSLPNAISGLQLWLDASDASTLFQDSALTTPVASNSDPVGGWKDKSGNNYHGLQATSGKRPAWQSSGLNGAYPTVKFDGTDDYLDHSAASGVLGMLKNIPGCTVVSVVKKTSGTGAMYWFAATTSAITVRVGTIFNQTNSHQITSGGRRLDADSFAGKESTGLSDATWYFVHSRYDYTNAQLGMSINSSDNPTAGSFQTAGNTSNVDGTRVLTGAFADANQNFKGEIAEIMIYNRLLTTGERDSLYGYLRNKYDLY